MKLKISILSAAAISLILMLLGTFIYYTVYGRVLQLHKADLNTQAQAIAQYYTGQFNDSPLEDTSSTQWLRQYVRRGQEVVLLNPDGHIIDSLGDINAHMLVSHFHKTQTPIQETFSTNTDATLIYTALPMTHANGAGSAGYVILASNAGDVQEYMESLFKVLVAGCVGAVLLAGIGGYLIAAAALRPVNQLIRVVGLIEANRLNQRVEVPKGRDEVARLTETFNHMLSRIQRSFEQQMRFVADASHEFRTPLTTILGYANLLNRWGKTDPEVLDKAIRVIRKESHRLQSLADDLLFLAGVEASSTQPQGTAPVDAVLAEVVDELSMVHPSVHIDKNLNAQVEGDIAPHHLKQIATNVIGNAFKYTPEGGSVAVRSWSNTHDVFIEVTDTGCGIPSEDIPHVFDRFYRVNKSRERAQGGSGLGLAIVKELVETYRGHIEIQSDVGSGTTVTIQLRIRSSLREL